MPNFKCSTMRNTAHRKKCKQVVEKQHHPVTRQVCEEVHYMVKCRVMAGQECKHVPMEHCPDKMHGFELLDWEDKVTKWDVWTDAMTLLYLQEVDRASRKDHTQPALSRAIRKDHTQPTLSRAGMYVHLYQTTEGWIDDLTNPTARAQPSDYESVKDTVMLGRGPITQVSVETRCDQSGFATFNRFGPGGYGDTQVLLINNLQSSSIDSGNMHSS